MTGISEILVLILLICGILILPRMFKPNTQSRAPEKKKTFLSMKFRGAVVASIAFAAISALVIKPWQGNLTLYLSVGILPVALAWAIAWVLAARN